MALHDAKCFWKYKSLNNELTMFLTKNHRCVQIYKKVVFSLSVAVDLIT